MIPVDQTTFGEGVGYCFSACVASILELSIGEVPFFGADELWWDRFQEWLGPRELYAMCITYRAGHTPRGFHILSGKSPRGDFLHATVARGADVVHDPHPSRDGIHSRVDCVVIVPNDIMESKRAVVEVAVEEEREACADIARDVMDGNVEIPRKGMAEWMACGEYILDEIRRRG
jgi:hypothetical protein